MSNREPRILLQEILDEIERIERFTSDVSLEDFTSDDMVYYATLRCLEIIGEAVKGLPKDLREAHQEIDWRKIAGLRDIITHAYFGIDPEIIWDVVKRKTPELKAVVNSMLFEKGG